MSTRRSIRPLASGWSDNHDPDAVRREAAGPMCGKPRTMFAPRRPFVALTAAVLLMLIFGTAQGASVQVYSGDATAAAWTTAAGTPVITEAFEDATLAGGLVITFGTTAGVTGCPSPGGCISDGKYRDRADDTQDVKPVFTFTPPIRAFGANWNLAIPTGQGTNIKLHLTFADSSFTDVATQIPNTFTGQFFGIVSDTPILKIRFDEGTSVVGTVETFDMDDARFVRFDSSVITTVAMNLNFPFGVAAQNGDVFYVADRNNHVVWKFDLSNASMARVAGLALPPPPQLPEEPVLPEGGYNGDDIPATTAQLNSPTGVAVANGNLYIADSGNHIVRKVVLSSGMISTVAGTPQKNGLAVNSTVGNPVIATESTLFGPRGVAIDGAGSIYIADTMNQQIRKVVNPGTMDAIITAVAGVAGETGNNDGSVATARLNSPLGVAVNTAGTLVYIADEGNDKIRSVSGGNVATVAAGTLDSPSGVTVALDGTLYIADTDNQRIQRVSGAVITTVAGTTDMIGDSGDGGPATAALLNHPVAVAVDSSGELLYIADLINNKIRKVDFTP